MAQRGGWGIERAPSVPARVVFLGRDRRARAMPSAYRCTSG